jgi:hypothetical protein
MSRKQVTALNALILQNVVGYIFDHVDGWFYNKRGRRLGCVKWVNANRRYVVIDMGQYGEHYAHRLAWLFISGDWPPEGYEVDHIDNDGENNAASNLRLLTKAQQQFNTKLGRNNRSGHNGISELPNGHFRVRHRFGEQNLDKTYKTRKEAEQTGLRWVDEVVWKPNPPVLLSDLITARTVIA